MIKVLQILQGGASFGGVENFLYQYYKQMDHEVVHFDFLFISEDSMKSKWAEESLHNSEHEALRLNIRNSRSIYKTLLNYLKKNRYDCIHVNTGNITIQFPCLIAAKKAGIKCRIAHSHSTGRGQKYTGIKKLVVYFIQSKIFKNSTVRAACSYEAAQHIFGEKADRDKIIIIPNAIDTELYRSNIETRKKIRQDLGFESEKVFIQVGSIYSVKNHSFTLDVFEKINEVFEDWRLIFVGKGELEDKIKEKADNLMLSDRIIFTGFRNDVYRFLQGADCMLVPSLWEGFPLTAIEGQAAGLPVICSDKVPHSADVTENCRFLPLEVDEWAEACLNSHVINNDPISRIIDRGYDIHIAAERLTELYNVECAR